MNNSAIKRDHKLRKHILINLWKAGKDFLLAGAVILYIEFDFTKSTRKGKKILMKNNFSHSIAPVNTEPKPGA